MRRSLICLVALAALPAMDLPPDGRLRLVVAGGAPLDGQPDPWVPPMGLHAGDEWHGPPPGVTPWASARRSDLVLDLDRRGGAWVPGWAWTAGLAGVEGRTAVLAATAAAGRLDLEVAVELPAHPGHQIAGGTARWRLALAAEGPDLRGTGTGTQAGADPATVQAVRRAGGGTPLRLRDGAVAAAATPSDPEPVEGRWGPVEPAWTPAPRPRLAFTPAAMARAAAAPAPEVRAAVRDLAAAPGADPGSAAAAWAFLALAEDDADAVDRSAAAAVRATAGVPSPRRLAGIALAYDALAERWPADTAAASRAGCAPRRR